MRTETIVRQLYQFDELSPDAKEKAREWYRGAGAHDEWWEFTYDDAVRCAAILGIEIATYNQGWHNVTSRKSGTRTKTAIFFSGFWSQGDGACFEGSYSWKAGATKAIREHAPKDTALHAIADELGALPYGEGWSAGIKHRGHYNHSGCMAIDVAFEDETYRQCLAEAGDPSGKQELPQAEFTAGEETITQAMRDFADWVYRQLETEHDYLNSNEQVDESIKANEYEFTESGERA